MVLNEQGTWTEMANSSQAMVAPPEDGRVDRPSGMLGFLGRKKGRERSPKAGKQRERGVIGKEGARVIINHG